MRQRPQLSEAYALQATFLMPGACSIAKCTSLSPETGLNFLMLFQGQIDSHLPEKIPCSVAQLD